MNHSGKHSSGYGLAMLADAHLDELHRSAHARRSGRPAPAPHTGALRVSTGRMLVQLGERLVDGGIAAAR
jgi:hypothetical protein